MGSRMTMCGEYRIKQLFDNSSHAIDRTNTNRSPHTTPRAHTTPYSSNYTSHLTLHLTSHLTLHLTSHTTHHISYLTSHLRTSHNTSQSGMNNKCFIFRFINNNNMIMSFVSYIPPIGRISIRTFG